MGVWLCPWGYLLQFLPEQRFGTPNVFVKGFDNLQDAEAHWMAENPHRDCPRVA